MPIGTYIVGALSRVVLLVAVGSFATTGESLGYDPCKGPYSPYSDFEAMAQSDLDSLQVKLTYAGPERGGRPIESIVFATSAYTVDMGLFDRLKRPRVRYSNDYHADEVTVSLSELKALIDSVGTVASLTTGTADELGYFSFSMVNTVNDTVVGYDVHIGESDCRDLFGKLFNLLENNGPGTEKLTNLGCKSGCLPTNTPTDVTDDMLVTVGGYRLDHDKNQFVTIVTVKNNGASAVDAPLILTVRVTTGSVAFMNGAGHTCRITPNRSYIVLPVETSLSAGASVEATLRFHNPTTDPIEFKSWVYSGDGIR